MNRIVNVLEARGALGELLPLMAHANVAVRCAAAIRCLATAADRAVPVLEAIVASHDVVEESGARWALERRDKSPSTP